MMHARPGDTVAGRFVIERLAGRGGMGEVFRARDLRDGQAVALKIMRVEGHDLGWFQREVRTLERLRHPNVARYVDHGMMGTGTHYLAMEWLDGEDLAARLEKGPLGIWSVVQAMH